MSQVPVSCKDFKAEAAREARLQFLRSPLLNVGPGSGDRGAGQAPGIISDKQNIIHPDAFLLFVKLLLCQLLLQSTKGI